MGRGRQKAKQTKVARELKYWSPATDYSQLERELRRDTAKDPWDVDDDSDDKYAAWADLAETDDGDADEA